MEYKDLIPETPAEELYAFMRDECDFFRENIVTFKAIGHREAEKAYFEDDFVGDFRENRKKRPARCWCSGCERTFLAEYISSKACSGMGIPAGIRMVDAYVAGEENVQDGHSIVCPYCGEVGVLHGASYMRMGHTEKHFLARAYTAQGCVVFVDYIAEQTIHQDRQEIRVEPFEAFVVDGKKVVKLRHWQRYMMGFFRLDDWETNKRFQDTLGCPWFYTRDLPGLEGTSLENAKLWEYMAQTYEKDRFYPVAYARTYLKHPSVENIITSGLGYLVGDGIYQERSAGSQAIPKLGWINWQEKRPSKMLGLTREEMRMAGKRKWDIQKLEAYQAVRHKLKPEEAVEAMKVLEPYHLKELGKDEVWTGARIMKAVRYLRMAPGPPDRPRPGAGSPEICHHRGGKTGLCQNDRPLPGIELDKRRNLYPGSREPGGTGPGGKDPPPLRGRVFQEPCTGEDHPLHPARPAAGEKLVHPECGCCDQDHHPEPRIPE